MKQFKSILVSNEEKEIFFEEDFTLQTVCLSHKIEDKSETCVKIAYNNDIFILCSLSPGINEMFNCGLEFSKGESIKIYCNNKNEVHLNGYTEEKENNFRIFHRSIDNKTPLIINEDRDINISIATLSNDEICDDRISLVVENEGCDVTLCNLVPDKSKNFSFSYFYQKETEVKFFVIGKGTIQLLGNYICQ